MVRTINSLLIIILTVLALNLLAIDYVIIQSIISAPDGGVTVDQSVHATPSNNWI